MPDRKTATNPRQSLARRYALQVGTITIVLLLASGLSEMYFGYHESREQISRLQHVQALAAAREIGEYLRALEDGVRDATKFPWGRGEYGTEKMREEFYRVMVLFPAITEIRDVDSRGLEQLFVSKSEPDRRRAGTPFSDSGLLQVSRSQPAKYGATFYREGADPLIHLALANSGSASSTVVATVNLRFLGDVVSGLRVGEGGQTYVVDGLNRLIAHRRPTHVLRQLDLSDFAPVRDARRAASLGGSNLLDATDTVDLDARPMISTAVRVSRADWLLFVEQPRSEALQPALSTLTRTVVLLAVGGGIALLVSLLFARRMAAPIVALRRATESISAGHLETDIDIRTGDEIQGLADDFNHMAYSLKESYSGLEAKVEQRTLELSDARDRLEEQATEMELLNSRLVDQLDEASQRKDEAERANAAKTRFLAAASHDLRQPMHSISLLVSVLRDRLVEIDHLALARKVELSVAAMENLFSSLLDISKLDAGVIRPNVQRVELDAVLRQIEHTFAPQAMARKLKLKVARSHAAVRSDPMMLERIVGNLVSNALRYTPSGGVVVGCRRRGHRIALQVIDTGPGIPASHLQDIFDEFFRLEVAGSGGDKGLGLGLSIVKRSAEMLGHEIRVESRIGLGSRFEVLLTPLGATNAATGAAIIGTSTAAALLQQVEGAFVVAVDDDEQNLMALEALCLQWGCHVLAARSPEEVLAKLGDHLRNPDLVITDHRLGQAASGFDVIECVRQQTGEQVAVVVVTADVSVALQKRAADVGAILLHKPAGAEKLLTAAAAALRSARA